MTDRDPEWRSVSEVGRSGSCDVEIHAATETGCNAARASYLQSYPWEAYMTSIGQPFQADNGDWVARGTRLSSCD